MILWREGSEPSLLTTIKKIFELNLFSLPEHFLIIAKRIDEELEDIQITFLTIPILIHTKESKG